MSIMKKGAAVRVQFYASELIRRLDKLICLD